MQGDQAIAELTGNNLTFFRPECGHVHPSLILDKEKGIAYLPKEDFSFFIGGPFSHPVLDTYGASVFVGEKYRGYSFGGLLIQLAGRIAKSEGAAFLFCPAKISKEPEIEEENFKVSIFERALGVPKENLPGYSWRLPLGHDLPFSFISAFINV